MIQVADKRPVNRSGLRKRVGGLIRGTTVLNPRWWMVYDLPVAFFTPWLAYVILGLKDRHFEAGLILMAGFSVAVLLAANICGLYDRGIFLSWSKVIIALTATIVISVVAFGFFTNVLLLKKVGRFVLLYSGLIFFLAAFIPRIAGVLLSKRYKRRIVMVGCPNSDSQLYLKLRGNRDYLEFLGYCAEDGNSDSECIGNIADIPRICSRESVDYLVVCRGYMERPDILKQCFESLHSKCKLSDEWSFYEEIFEEVPVNSITESWFFTSKINITNQWQAFLKRMIDILMAGSGLILSLPLIPLIWVLVRLTSWGPALYAQVRCGHLGKPFKLYKFRTMVLNAERNGAEWATEKDPRVTPFGSFLRKTRLDELPQLWNVLKGDMSFVGPRPERPELVKVIEKEVPYFTFRNWARPGITGLAQIRYRYGASVEDARKKLQYDLYYIKNWSILLDLQIILRTIAVLMKGAR